MHLVMLSSVIDLEGLLFSEEWTDMGERRGGRNKSGGRVETVVGI